MKTIKHIKQKIPQHPDPISMKIFHQMANRCIKIGLKNDSPLKTSMSLYRAQYEILSSYKLNIMSQVYGKLFQIKQSIKLGKKIKSSLMCQNVIGEKL